jgi:hypothetical protein
MPQSSSKSNFHFSPLDLHALVVRLISQSADMYSRATYGLNEIFFQTSDFCDRRILGYVLGQVVET